jgi:hypothetical protein
LHPYQMLRGVQKTRQWGAKRSVAGVQKMYPNLHQKAPSEPLQRRALCWPHRAAPKQAVEGSKTAICDHDGETSSGGKIDMRPQQMAEAANVQRPEILLITENKTILLEMGATENSLQSQPLGKRTKSSSRARNWSSGWKAAPGSSPSTRRRFGSARASWAKRTSSKRWLRRP